MCREKNPLIAEVAAKFEVPLLLDVDPPIADAVRRFPAAEVVNPENGVHLHLRGELVFARAVFTRLEELGWLD